MKSSDNATPGRKRRIPVVHSGLCAGLLCLFLLVVVLGGGAIRREFRQQKRNQSLITAIKAADAHTAGDLLNRGADPNSVDTPQQKISLWRFLQDRLRGPNRAHSGTPVLELAITRSRSPSSDKAEYARGVSIVQALLEHGAYIDIKDEQGVDMITLAIETDYDSPQMLRLLLQHLENISPRSMNGQPSILDVKNPVNRRTALMSAAAWGVPEEIDLLLQAGAKVDLRDDGGQSALMYAVEKGRTENVDCLLKYHADALLKDRKGNTPLSTARANRDAMAVTPFNHDVKPDFWPHIVKMLEHAR